MAKHRSHSSSGWLLALSARGRAEPVDITNPGWQSELPGDDAEAFDQDLARLGDKEPLARALLAALAWAKGPGLPWENIWARVAQALAELNGTPLFRSPRLITDDDVRWLLDKAGAYVVEDAGSGQRSVYRPFHDRLAAHLRGEPGARRAASCPVAAESWQEHRARIEKAMTDALLDTMPATGRLGTGRPLIPTCGPTLPSTRPPLGPERCPLSRAIRTFSLSPIPSLSTPLLPSVLGRPMWLGPTGGRVLCLAMIRTTMLPISTRPPAR